VKKRSKTEGSTPRLRIYLIPCSCGTSFAVPEADGRLGSGWSRFPACPCCGKRHDPKNRLLELGFQHEGYWKVEKC